MEIKMDHQYSIAFWGLLLIIGTVLIQSMVAAATKGNQPGAVPGKIDPSLSHESFVFRSNRTLMNSLENLPLILGAAFLAILMEASVFWTGLLIWIIALSRLLHMVLYYKIATEKNPSPRSYFFLLGFLANAALLVLCGVTLID
jgi:uncharacterized MAPEG superfamily protein